MGSPLLVEVDESTKPPFLSELSAAPSVGLLATDLDSSRPGMPDFSFLSSSSKYAAKMLAVVSFLPLSPGFFATSGI